MSRKKNKNILFSLILDTAEIANDPFELENLENKLNYILTSTEVKNDFHKFVRNDGHYIIYFFKIRGPNKLNKFNQYCDKFLPEGQSYSLIELNQDDYNLELYRLKNDPSFKVKPELVDFFEYEENDIKMFEDSDNWLPWQKKIYSEIFNVDGSFKTPGNPGIINIVDKTENFQKSSFFKWLFYKYSKSIGRIGYESVEQVLYTISKIGQKPLYIIDLGKIKLRNDEEKALISILENMQVRFLSSLVNANENKLAIKPLNIIILSNYVLNYSLLSKDQVKLYDLTTSNRAEVPFTPLFQSGPKKASSRFSARIKKVFKTILIGIFLYLCLRFLNVDDLIERLERRLYDRENKPNGGDGGFGTFSLENAIRLLKLWADILRSAFDLFIIIFRFFRTILQCIVSLTNQPTVSEEFLAIEEKAAQKAAEKEISKVLRQARLEEKSINQRLAIEQKNLRKEIDKVIREDRSKEKSAKQRLAIEQKAAQKAAEKEINEVLRQARLKEKSVKQRLAIEQKNLRKEIDEAIRKDRLPIKGKDLRKEIAEAIREDRSKEKSSKDRLPIEEKTVKEMIEKALFGSEPPVEDDSSKESLRIKGKSDPKLISSVIKRLERRRNSGNLMPENTNELDKSLSDEISDVEDESFDE